MSAYMLNALTLHPLVLLFNCAFCSVIENDAHTFTNVVQLISIYLRIQTLSEMLNTCRDFHSLNFAITKWLSLVFYLC